MKQRGDFMKKILPIALIGAAVGSAAWLLNRKNKKHIQETLTTLDEISMKASDTIQDLANQVFESDSEDSETHQ